MTWDFGIESQLVRQGFGQTADTLETMETTMSGSKKLQTTPEFFDIGTWPRASLAHEMVHVMADLVSEARWLRTLMPNGIMPPGIARAIEAAAPYLED